MKNILTFLVLGIIFLGLTSESSCSNEAQSTSGVKKAQTTIKTDLNGQTSEQYNVIKRYEEDNKPGAIKHLYIISAYSGQVILYSPVKGKVTSSGKRLSPSTAQSSEGGGNFKIDMSGNGDRYFYTNEVLGDDGTYGNSVEYIYWWDTKDVYHQQYITGGLMFHISSQPISVKSVIINTESINNK